MRVSSTRDDRLTIILFLSFFFFSISISSDKSLIFRSRIFVAGAS